MGMISDALTKLVQVHSGLDGDFADRLNFKYTSLLFILLGVLVTTRQFVGDAIVCYTPHEFDEQRSAYADAYCWVSNTYYLPLHSHHDPLLDQMHPRRILYYQWTPLILFLQAFWFAMPHFFWRSIYKSVGIDFEKITREATKFDVTLDKERWNALIHGLATHVDRYLEMQHSQGHQCFGLIKNNLMRRLGHVLTIFYPLVKIMFLINIVMQMYALTYWLGDDYRQYGYTVIYSFIYLGTSLREVTNLFPRVTWCTVETRVLEKVFEWQIHCVLPINLFNEMVYLLVWFWLLFVFVFTALSFVYWAYKSFCSLCDPAISNYLFLGGKPKERREKIQMEKFVRFYLKSDGVFILRLLSKNSNSIFMTDFTTQLFDIYKEKVEKSRGGNGGTTNKEEETPLPQKKGSGVYFDSWKQADQFRKDNSNSPDAHQQNRVYPPPPSPPVSLRNFGGLGVMDPYFPNPPPMDAEGGGPGIQFSYPMHPTSQQMYQRRQPHMNALDSQLRSEA